MCEPVTITKKWRYRYVERGSLKLSTKFRSRNAGAGADGYLEGCLSVRYTYTILVMVVKVGVLRGDFLFIFRRCLRRENRLCHQNEFEVWSRRSDIKKPTSARTSWLMPLFRIPCVCIVRYVLLFESSTNMRHR